MNLAQAVAVLAYELAPARVGARRRAPPRAAARAARGTRRWRRSGTGCAALLGAAGYLNPQNPEHILADFRRLLARAEPTQREVELLLAAVRALERKLRERAPPTAG